MSFCQEKRRRHEAENSAQFIEQAKSDAQTQQSKLQEVPGFKKGSLKTSLFAFVFPSIFRTFEKIWKAKQQKRNSSELDIIMANQPPPLRVPFSGIRV